MEILPISPWLFLANQAAESATPAAAQETPLLLMFAVVTVLLFINGFFVALEFALVGLRPTRIEEMVQQNVRGAHAVKRGKENVDDFVAAAQLGITMASLALGTFVEPAVASRLQPLFHSWGIENQNAIHTVTWLIGIGLLTIFHVWLGEQVPKMLAIHDPARVALVTAPPTEIFLKVCKYLIRGLSRLTEITLRVLGIKESGHHGGEVHSEEEIRSLLLVRQKAGLAEAAESEMIARVFNFFDMVATQAMVPRTEMVSIPSKASLREAMEIAAEAGHDRYPVYGENLDDVVGVMLLKDLVTALNEDERNLQKPVTTILRDVLRVPGSLPVSQLMAQMREHHTRLAIVLDEYGGTAGMVTVGDFLERIMGEVEELEADKEEAEDIEELGNGLYSISGLLLTEDVEDHFDLEEIQDEHNDTIGGVVFSMLGRKPEVGDVVELGELELKVEELDGNRIDRLLVRRTATSPSSEEETAVGAS